MSEHDENDHDGVSEVPSRDRQPNEKPPERDRRESDGKEDEKKPEEKKNDEGEEKEKKKGSGKPSKKALIIGGIVVVLIAVGGLLYYLHARNYVSTDDAFVAGHVHEISSRVPGTVLSVLVDDNEAVHKGNTLLALDPREFDLSLEKARAQLAQSRAQAQQAQAQVTQQSASSAQASAQLEKAMTDFQRVTSLYQKDLKAVSKAEVDTNSAELKSAKAAFEASKANETSARAQREVAQAGVKNAEAAVHDAELQLTFTTINAPVDGFVAKKTVESGRRLQPGQALMAVVESDVWVVANLKETQMAEVKIGQAVTIDVDAVPDHEFKGRVDSFQQGTGAVFALLPPDNATGNFTKIVQRVPVKIVFEPDSIRGYGNRLVPGLSVAPTIDLRSR